MPLADGAAAPAATTRRRLEVRILDPRIGREPGSTSITTPFGVISRNQAKTIASGNPTMTRYVTNTADHAGNASFSKVTSTNWITNQPGTA